MSHLLVNFNRLLDYRSREQLLQMDDLARQELLQELLRQNPSEATWRAICELYASWPEGEEKAKSLLIADQALGAWDDRLRHLSSSWPFLYDGKQLSSLAPLVRSIKLYRREEHGNREIRTIVKSELAQSLTHLTVFRSELTNMSFKAIADSPYISRLQYLEIKKTVMSEVDIERLFQTKGLPNLKALKLIDIGLRHDWLHPISQLTPFASLESIDFSHNVLGSEGLIMLCHTPWLACIRILELRANYIRDDGIIALSKSRYLKKLKLLDLSGNPLTEVGKDFLLDMAKGKGIKLII